MKLIQLFDVISNKLRQIKEAAPEPSEEMKPGMIYTITLQVDVIKNEEQRDLCTMILTNDTTDEHFVVKQLKINPYR
ncbi:hypothetical protein ACFFMS_17900 [Ectobacillus funiculus]|uniref:Uncharacterized protein n=1 Tax=Ectobacillus funiculus TaxID=137993 RepID=A0ABV5WJ56_9BACI